jgi:hypothetical protein
MLTNLLIALEAKETQKMLKWIKMNVNELKWAK